MYDIGALTLLISVGLTLVVTGVLAAGWRHKTLIWGLIGSGVLVAILGLASPLLARSWPWMANQFSNMGASPSAWFTLFMFIVALVVFWRPKGASRVIHGESREDSIATTPTKVGSKK